MMNHPKRGRGQGHLTYFWSNGTDTRVTQNVFLVFFMKIATRNVKIRYIVNSLWSQQTVHVKMDVRNLQYKNDIPFIADSCIRILLLEIVRALYQFSVLMMYFYARYRSEYTSSIDSPVNDCFDENPQKCTVGGGLRRTCSGCIEQTVDLSELLDWIQCHCHTFLTEQKSNWWWDKILARSGLKHALPVLWKY